MNRLMRANFARLWKSKVFWGCVIFMLAGLNIDCCFTVQIYEGNGSGLLSVLF